jgi:hypothetical protein
MKKALIINFWVLMVVALFVIGQLFVPVMQEALQGKIFLLPLIVYSALGASLIYFTFKSNVTGKSKKFLLLTGFSVASFFVFALLHNVFYAFAVLSEHIWWLAKIFEVMHAGFFLIGTLASPAGFFVGSIGSIILLLKKRV